MRQIRDNHVFQVMMVVFVLLPSYNTVTVSPSLCPTNKIAPHRRVAASARTFAAYYDLLLGPNTPGTRPQTENPLLEQPQADQPDDCGEIEDYDENDLSAVSQQNRRRSGRADNRFFFGGWFNRPVKVPAYSPSQTPHSTVSSFTPARPTRPTVPQRPYWSGGYFSQNQYKPPPYQEPSDNFKPVHEPADVSEFSQTYRPGLVGGPLGHVVGLTQARPTVATVASDENRRRYDYLSNRIQRTTQPTFYTTRHPRSRQMSNDDSILGSFLGLFFK